MPHQTLLDFFAEIVKAEGDCIIYDNGLRSWSYSYAQLGRDAHALAARLIQAGIAKGDKIVIWGENRPEWVVAFWGGMLIGAVLVPIDYRSSAEFLQRVQAIVHAKIIFIGEEVAAVDLESISIGATIWPLTDLLGGISSESIETVDAVKLSPNDLAEIIFTSGATAEPKGVVITHKNILANIGPIGREWIKYRKYARPFLPLRFLNLLPMSHLFGQAMALFIPPIVESTVVFLNRYDPKLVVRLIKRLRISVVVSVPKVLELLREYITGRRPETRETPGKKRHVFFRWLRHWRIHRMFGFKFWSFVVGAAPLDPDLEEFWSRLGFLVVQGYGLTETAPIVSLNHPLDAKSGSVGKAMPGLEVKIAGDGEILVRGDSVTSGYYNAETASAEVFEDGWLHTGDIGGLDDEGRLYIRGRKKEMIVTPEGLKVFPEDVERVLNSLPGVADSAVVGLREGVAERVQAVVVLDSKNPPLVKEIFRAANSRLADHQKLRGITIWPGSSLPRTEGTLKLKRREIRSSIENSSSAEPAPASKDALRSILGKYATGGAIDSNATVSELGLTSLERIELMLELEAAFGSSIDEKAFSEARGIEDLRALVAHPAAPSKLNGPPDGFAFPAWSLGRMARAIRRLSLAALILPLVRLFAWIRVEGLENLSALDGPVVFAANHQSHMDTPVILAALPRRLRHRVAVAMAKEFFSAHFHPDRHSRLDWLTNSLNYYLAALFFNAFPLPKREAGSRDALAYMGRLASSRYSILIFPEGRRSETGEITRFQPGVGMIASRLDLPVVPVRVEGIDKVLRVGWKMARPGRVRVAFGAPLNPSNDDYEKIASDVEEAVKRL